MSAAQEALFLAGTLPVLILIFASALAVRVRNPWGGLIVVVLWTVFITLLITETDTNLRTATRAEGCVGSPALFICGVAAICVGIILYTLPRPKRPD